MRRAAILLAALVVFSLLPSVAAAASRPCEEMRSRLVRGGGGASGLLVVDAETGRVVCARAANRARSLASNMKLFTTATALYRFGPDHRIQTSLFASGGIDFNGRLHGDLYLRGAGDPTLGSPAFYNRFMGGLGTNLFGLKQGVAAAGIESVQGRLHYDDSVFDRLRGVADSGYATSPYIGPLSGLSFNSGYRDSNASGFAGDPAKLAASKLARSLSRAGIGIPPTAARGIPPGLAQRIATVRSPEMSRLADATNVPSNNFFAEMLIKLLGARFGRSGSTAAGAQVVERFARQIGSGVHAVDGSGLTRGNRASPRQVIDLLLGMRRSYAVDEFIQSLAVTGREGTVDERTEGTAAYGRCRTKTGTLTGVSALSGYCFNRSGRVMAFSVLMTSVSSLYLAHHEQDLIAAAVASY
jgi:D-alanyl-D-alanine carboxypeptidase/D-alanyl-D-alanine-endopeptidase (penicillin-binding protein 4)